MKYKELQIQKKAFGSEYIQPSLYGNDGILFIYLSLLWRHFEGEQRGHNLPKKMNYKEVILGFLI